MWTEAVSGKKKLRIQKHLDACGHGPNPKHLKYDEEKNLNIILSGEIVFTEREEIKSNRGEKQLSFHFIFSPKV